MCFYAGLRFFEQIHDSEDEVSNDRHSALRTQEAVTRVRLLFCVYEILSPSYVLPGLMSVLEMQKGCD
jgi:hypothetical protein